MSKKKIIAVAIVLALILLIGGMLAYFTDTDTQTNVFTLGDGVDIAIDEDWTATNGEGIHPGAVVTKAPSIVNESTTTPAYVFAEITVPCYTKADGTTDVPLFTFTPNAGWTLMTTTTENGATTYLYAYGSDSAMTELAASATTTTAVFSTVTLDSTLTEDDTVTSTDIIVNAYGIQTDNVGTTPTAVFANFSA